MSVPSSAACSPSTSKRGCCEHDHSWEKLALWSLLCGAAGMGGYAIQTYTHLPSFIAQIVYGISFLFGAWEALQEIPQKLFKGKLDIHFLMVTVALGAAFIGAWGEAALLLFLFSASGAMEAFAAHKTQEGIDKLLKKTPQSARKILANGEEVTVALDEIDLGDRLRVLSGDIFPVDGVLKVGETAVDESNFTGESIPVSKTVGDAVFSGTVNLWGSVEVEVQKLPDESAFQKVLRLIHDSQNLKAPAERFTERFSTPYTLTILALTILMFFVWHLGYGLDAFNMERGMSAFYKSMTLLVVASPCALILSIPSAILAAIAWGAQKGILFRGGRAVEQLANIQVLAADKTGTLTTGLLQVFAVESLPSGREDDILRWAASLEVQVKHPIAAAILQYAKLKQLELEVPQEVKTLTGLGVQGVLSSGRVTLGSMKIFEEMSLNEHFNFCKNDQDDSEVYVMGLDTHVSGRILLRDSIRKESFSIIKALHRLGLKVVMLTGDRFHVAKKIAAALGIQELHADLRPEDKVNILQNLKQDGQLVAMIGDGFNDAPSLAAADVSIGMGVRGSDASLEQSDIVLMRDDLNLVLSAYALSVQSQRIIRQNLTIALMTIFCMVLSAVLGVIPLSVGVIAHEGSTVLVCLNSLRLLWSKYSRLI